VESRTEESVRPLAVTTQKPQQKSQDASGEEQFYLEPL